MIVLAAALAVPAMTSCERGGEPEQRAAAPVSVSFAGIPQQGDALGDPAAPVTLTELSDLRCSHCRDFTLNALPVLVERYVRLGHLRIVFRNLPVLGAASERAARMAVAAGMQDRMWPFVHAFFSTRDGEGAAEVTDAFLRRVAAAVPGLDVDRALADRDEPAVRAELAENARLAREMGVRGVPTFTLGRTGEPARELSFRRSGDPDSFTGPVDELLESKPEAK